MWLDQSYWNSCIFPIRGSVEGGRDEKKTVGYILEMAISWDLRGRWKQKQMLETV